jgi:two-component system, sensor histidine kinase
VFKNFPQLKQVQDLWIDLLERSKGAREPAIAQELFRLGYRNLWAHLIGQVCLSSLVGIASFGIAPRARLTLWSIWMGFTVLAIAAGLFMFRPRIRPQGMQSTKHVPKLKQMQDRTSPTIDSSFPKLIVKWRATHLMIVCLIGIGWGSVGLLLQPGKEQHNIMLLISFAGTMAYSSASNGPHDIRGFFVSALIAFCILSTQLPRTLGDSSTVVTAMAGLYFLVLTITALSARLTLIDSIALRLKNEELARKNAENAARAEQANREKSEFLAAASHDLRQPVHALLLLLEAYERDDPVAARHPLVQSIIASGKSIGDLFNSLMEISRLENFVEQPKSALFDVTEVVARVFDRVRPEAESKGLTFKVRVAKKLPRRTLLSDRFMLERVLSNLLVNAVRYTKQGGVLLTVRPAPRPSSDAVQSQNGLWIEVWDSGIGIAKEHQARIYEPYVQLGNQHRDRSKGLGLGLSIVKRTLDLLGMELSLKSKLNRGSRFRIHVPAIVCKVDRTKNLVAQTYAKPSNNLSNNDVASLKGQKILLIDDDTMVQNAMLALLKSWGAEVRVFSSIEALEELIRNDPWTPDSILSDFRLPGQLNGLAVLQMMRAQFPMAHCFLQTGELAQSVDILAQEAGIPVLFKPVSPLLLLTSLRQQLSSN